jgi:hypothetical protein
MIIRIRIIRIKPINEVFRVFPLGNAVEPISFFIFSLELRPIDPPATFNLNMIKQ